MDPTYLPPLDHCLAGLKPVIPWSSVLDLLLLDTDFPTEIDLRDFLFSEQAIAVLAKAHTPFSAPSDQSKKEFETRTAPIHTASRISEEHKVDQIKEDSLWLSKQVSIDEVSALRIVIVEWQRRATDVFLGRLPSSQTLSKGDGKAEAGLDNTIRHRRLLHTFLVERSAIRSISAALFGIDASTPEGVISGAHESWINGLAQKLRAIRPDANSDQSARFIFETFAAGLERLQGTQKWPECFQIDFALHDVFLSSVLRDLISTIREALRHVFGTNISQPKTILNWFNAVKSAGFLQGLAPASPEQSALCETLQCLTAVLLAALLRISESIEELDRSVNGADVTYPNVAGRSYLEDNSCIRELNVIIFEAAETGALVSAPAALAWSVISMYIRDTVRVEQEEIRRLDDEQAETGGMRHGSVTRRPSDMELKYDCLQDQALAAARDDPPQHLARLAVDGLNVYAVITNLCRILSSTFSTGIDQPTTQLSRTALYNVTRESLPTVTYDEHVLEATLAILSPQSKAVQDSQYSAGLVQRFWSDQTRFRPMILQQAVLRYPYELCPLLQLINIISGAVATSSSTFKALFTSFQELSTITISFQEGFRGYVLEHEEEGVNSFKLSQELPIFVGNPRLQVDAAEAANLALDAQALRNVLAIPTGTPGVILRDSRPFVVSLEHQHSGFNYIGLLLNTMVSNPLYILAPPAAIIDSATAAEIIALITTLLRKAKHKSDSEHLFHELSAALPEDTDIISVIAELLESSSLAYTERAAESGTVDLLISCIEFVHALADCKPERMWTVLAQSSMLEYGTATSANLSTYSETEDISKYQRLLDGYVALYQVIVEDAVSGLVKRRRKIDRKRPGNRFDSPVDDTVEISDRSISQVLVGLTKLVVNLLNGLSEPSNLTLEGRAGASSGIAQSFKDIFVVAYGVEASSNSSKILGNVFTDIAEMILSALSVQTSQKTTYALASFLAFATQVDDPGISTNLRAVLVQQAKSILDLTTILLRVVQARKQHADALISALAVEVPQITTLFAAHALLRKSAAGLLTQLIVALDNGDEPASIFNSLTPEQGTAFLQVLTSFDRPLPDIATECKIWNLFAAACEHGQQWFAMYLLTGSLPRQRLTDQKDKSTTILSSALDTLSNIKNVSPERAASMMDFIAKAQRLWIWATNIVRSHPDFINNALAWLSELKPHSKSSTTADALLEAREFSMVAAFCDILAANIHAGLEIGDSSLLKLVATKSSYLSKHAIITNAYNHALHKKLAGNISNRFDGLKLYDLKRTAINAAPIGSDYIYDTTVAEQLLRHDSSWAGSGKSNGFVDEFARANINLSLVDAQFRLATEWKTLAITLADSAESSPELQQVLVETINSCLEANLDCNTEEPKAALILQMRADLVFVLMSRLVKAPYKGPEAHTLLLRVWNLLRISPVDYSVAQAQLDLAYYRSLLQSLFLALQLCAVPKPSKSVQDMDDELISVLVEIVSRTVTTGFRALCGNLHETESFALADDFAMLTAIMQAVLAISSTKQYYVQIADIVIQSGVVRSAASLYSWSDHLAGFTNQDPVYGEVAIMFLVTLSKVPQIAEHIALDGVLAKLSSANLSNHLRKAGGRSQFDEPGRMFTIWVDGFLPLCLNLLDSVGPPVVADISSFLNSFPEQLERAERALQNVTPNSRNPRAGAVTLGLVTEARDLVLLAQVLKASINLGAAEGISTSDVDPLRYDINIVQNNVEALTKSQRSLRDRILPVTARDMALLKNKTASGSDDALQAAVVKEIALVATLCKD